MEFALKDGMSGMDILYYTVNIFSNCPDHFNYRFTAEELIKLALAYRKAGHRFMHPDGWMERQIQECLHLGKIPRWKDDGSPDYDD